MSGHDEPVVSVIVPMRNEARWVGDQMAAFARQDPGVPWELIVVDNGSTDDSVSIVEQFRDQLPYLCVVSAPDASCSGAARNAGSREARGELLVTADADDVVSDGWLRAMAHALREHEMVSGRIEVSKLNPPGSFAWRIETNDGLPVAAGFLPFASSSNLGIRRQVFEEMGGFDKTIKYSEDVDLSFRVQLAGHAIARAPEALVHRRLRGTTRALFMQHFRYGRTSPLIYIRFRAHGMPRSGLREIAKEWMFLAVRSYRLGDPGFRRFWCVVAGRRLGRIVGSAEQRVLYL
jgi:glycosyltransferase involved in cell wall biosynthesis